MSSKKVSHSGAVFGEPMKRVSGDASRKRSTEFMRSAEPVMSSDLSEVCWLSEYRVRERAVAYDQSVNYLPPRT